MAEWFHNSNAKQSAFRSSVQNHDDETSLFFALLRSTFTRQKAMEDNLHMIPKHTDDAHAIHKHDGKITAPDDAKAQMSTESPYM